MKKQLLLGLLLAATSYQTQASSYLTSTTAKYVAGAALVGAGLYALYRHTVTIPMQSTLTQTQSVPVAGMSVASATIQEESPEVPVAVVPAAPVVVQVDQESVASTIPASELHQLLPNLTATRPTRPGRRNPTRKTAEQIKTAKQQAEDTQAASEITSSAEPAVTQEQPAPKPKPAVAPRKKTSGTQALPTPTAPAAAATTTSVLPTQTAVEAGPSAQDARAMFRARLNQTLAQQTAILPQANPERAARIAALCNQTAAAAAAIAEQDNEDEETEPVLARLKRMGARRI